MHPCAIVVCSGARWQEYWDGEELYKAPLIITICISLFYSKYLAEFLVGWLFDELCICFRWEVFKVVSVSFFYTGSATCSPEHEALAFQVPQALLSPALHPAVAPDPGPAKEAISIREASCFFGWTTICPSAKASAVFWRSLGSALAKLKIAVLINISNLKPNCSVPALPTNASQKSEGQHWEVQKLILLEAFVGHTSWSFTLCWSSTEKKAYLWAAWVSKDWAQVLLTAVWIARYWIVRY